MLKLKSGVRLDGMRPELIPALMAAQEAYAQVNAALILTSVTDGRHGTKSFHYSGLAFDARTHHITSAQAEEITALLKEALSACYDVVLENDHLHIEYDPKPRLEEPPVRG